MIPIGTPCIIIHTAYPHLMGAYCCVVRYEKLRTSDHLFHVPADTTKPYWHGKATDVRPIGPPPGDPPVIHNERPTLETA